MCLLVYTNLQDKTHYRQIAPSARSEKSQHSYIVSKSLSGLETFPNSLLTGVRIRISWVEKNRKIKWRGVGGTSIRHSRLRGHSTKRVRVKKQQTLKNISLLYVQGENQDMLMQ